MIGDSGPTSRDGGTGRRSGLKIRRGQPRGGSTPPPGTNSKLFRISQFTGYYLSLAVWREAEIWVEALIGGLRVSRTPLLATGRVDKTDNKQLAGSEGDSSEPKVQELVYSARVSLDASSSFANPGRSPVSAAYTVTRLLITLGF